MHRDVLLFRRKYGYGPADRRVLDLTLEDVQLDLEIEPYLKAAKRGDDARECFACGARSYRLDCPGCGGEMHSSLEDWASDQVDALQKRDGREWTIEEYEAALGRLVQEKRAERGEVKA